MCDVCHAEITKDDLEITFDTRWTPSHKNKEGKSFTVPRTSIIAWNGNVSVETPHVTATPQSLNVHCMWILLQISSPQMNGEWLHSFILFLMCSFFWNWNYTLKGFLINTFTSQPSFSKVKGSWCNNNGYQQKTKDQESDDQNLVKWHWKGNLEK